MNRALRAYQTASEPVRVRVLEELGCRSIKLSDTRQMNKL